METKKFALRMCLRKWDSTYYELLHYSELPTLKNRRSFLKQCTLYNIIHGHFYYPPDIFVHKVSRRHADSSHLLHQPRAHTNSFHSSFVLDSISMWNNLPVKPIQLLTLTLSNISFLLYSCRLDTHLY